MIKKVDQNGFTIIELLVATSVFTSVLFIVTYGIIQISKTYTNGFIRSQTQNIAVSLSDTLTRDIEFSSTASIQPDLSVQVKTGSGTVDYYYFCSTQNEYFYKTYPAFKASGNSYSSNIPTEGSGQSKLFFTATIYR